MTLFLVSSYCTGALIHMFACCTDAVSVANGTEILRRGVFWPVYAAGWIVRNAYRAAVEAFR